MTETNGAEGNTSGNDGVNESFLDSFTNEDLKSNEHLTSYVGENGGGLEKLASDFAELKANQPSIPEDADGYKFEAPEDLDPTVAESYNGLKAVAHENGITQQGYEALIAFDQERRTAWAAAEQAKVDETINAMKDEMGEKFEENLKSAQNVLKVLGAESLMQDRELGNNPDLMRMLVKVAGSISEDKLSGGNGPTNKPAIGDAGQRVIKYENM